MFIKVDELMDRLTLYWQTCTQLNFGPADFTVTLSLVKFSFISALTPIAAKYSSRKILMKSLEISETSTKCEIVWSVFSEAIKVADFKPIQHFFWRVNLGF